MVLLWWWLTLGFESYTDSMKPPPFVRPQEKKRAGLCLFFIPWSAETWSKSGFCFLELSENPGFCLKNKGDTAMCSVWNVQPYARHAIAVWSTAAAVVVLVFIISSYSNLCLVTDCLNFKLTSVSHINRCVLRAEHDSILIRWIAGKSYSNSERDSSQWGRWYDFTHTHTHTAFSAGCKGYLDFSPIASMSPLHPFPALYFIVKKKNRPARNGEKATPIYSWPRFPQCHCFITFALSSDSFLVELFEKKMQVSWPISLDISACLSKERVTMSLFYPRILKTLP